VVGKDWIIDDECDKTIKSIRLNSEPAMKSVWTINPPVLKKIELGRLGDRGSFLKDMCIGDVSQQFLVSMPPVPVIFLF
jgi:hypothetical protein